MRPLTVAICHLVAVAADPAALAAPSVVINEIHFAPANKRPLEFVELHNAGDQPAQVAGWKLDKFTVPAETTIAPGGYLVIAEDPAELKKEFGVAALGPLAGRLSNEGEKLTLLDTQGEVVETVRYGVGFPWPTGSVAAGSSIERIHPSLNESSPGHWRASGFGDTPPGRTMVVVPAGSKQWHWRKGTSEASNPAGAWRGMDFKEDESWRIGPAGFGYGDNDDASEIGDMQGRYTSLFLRHRFTAPTKPESLVLRIRVDDGCIVWVNGREIARLHMPGGEPRFDSVAQDHEASEWQEVALDPAATLLTNGENLLAVQVFNSSRESSDLSFDLALQTPDGTTRARRPTPGARNSVFTERTPMAVQSVTHEPAQPTSGRPVTIAATLSGAASANLQLQLVDPGAYIRKADSEYETRWEEVPMHDEGKEGDEKAGDSIFTARLVGEYQKNRRLVRYRVTARDRQGASLRLPYLDDPSPNFAYFVWDGPAEYVAAPQPGKSAPLSFSSEMQRTLPIFTLIANADDVLRSQWDGGYHHRRLPGTFVFEGKVHDHMLFNNRGSASTYVAGKNKWGFHFLPAHELAMRDPWGRPYKETWNSFAMNACASPWVQSTNRGMAGLDEAVSFRAYQLAGVPASDTIPVHVRVITSKEERGPTQYDGDLWGLYLAVEDPDGAWLKNHKLPDGLTWKPEDGAKHVPAGLTGNPGVTWQELKAGPRGRNAEEWWRAQLDLPGYFSFHAINALVSNVDLRPDANHAFYRHPQRGWVPVPWDLDMQFIPRTHQAGYIDEARCLEIPAIRLEYRNRARELLDLLAEDPRPDGGQIGQVVAEYARRIAPPGQQRTWAELDWCRWNYAPQTQSKGIFYQNPGTQGMSGGSFTRTLATPDFGGFCKHVVEFCTDSRPKKDYQLNDGNPLGYGWGRLAAEAHDASIPSRPTIRYTGPEGFPGDALRFESSGFADPQGEQTFAALEWRLAEVGQLADAPWPYEIEALWNSGEIPAPTYTVHLPGSDLRAGHSYRVRVRHKDQTGRWSRWSECAQFTPR